ncbi:MAG: phosphoenolpyruvate synthase PpsA [Oligoflexia bacterium]|nr:phosphoenolpyruvate synthase PpsA [Oligoflexia bacterium]
MHSYSNFKTYHNLMPYRVKEILIVSSPYDAFIMEEDGGLMEHVFASDRGMNMTYPPRFTIVSTIRGALDIVSKYEVDVVVIMPRYLEMDAVSFGSELKQLSIKRDMAVILLVQSSLGLTQYAEKLSQFENSIDKLFVWHGNRNILWAILKWQEDKMNVVHDTEEANVQVLILVEDSPTYYSSLLPLIYEAIFEQTQNILEEGVNDEHRLLHLRARTKLLLASNYEQALSLYNKFKPYLLGLFSDIRYPKNRGGEIDDEAGISLLKKIKKELPYLPTFLFSSEEKNREKAKKIKAFFLDKNSPTLLQEIRQFFLDNLGFGDYIFRMPSGTEVARAANLVEMERILSEVPDESLKHQAVLGHSFSTWFLARSQFELAQKVRNPRYEDFSSVQEIRKFLIDSIHSVRILQRRGIVINFDRNSFYPESEFLKIGNGSMGGKARGLAFMLKCIENNTERLKKFSNIKVTIPKTLVITTDIYDQFLEENNLEEFIKIECSDEIIASRFVEAKLPTSLEEDLLEFLEHARYPLAVRSSGLLEDSQFKPYAGIYKTYMLPNDHSDIKECHRQLLRAIKLIYASVFYKPPRTFAKTTGHRTEEEQMAISIQELCGQRFGDYYYPTISGTAQSHNFYPVSFMKAEEGVAHIALGLGKTVVDGGQSLRFSPKYPQVLPQFYDVTSILKNAQQYFYALKMGSCRPSEGRNGITSSDYIDNNISDYNISNHNNSNCSTNNTSSINSKRFTVQCKNTVINQEKFKCNQEIWLDDDVNLHKRLVVDAVSEGANESLMSVYVAQDNQISDTTSKRGTPILTFANILKYDMLPVAELISTILEIGKEGLGCDIELEYAINIKTEKNHTNEFILLQIRPMANRIEDMDIVITKEDVSNAVVYSTNALGRGILQNVRDVVFVKKENFSFRDTVAIAKEISEINAKFEEKNQRYLLIGPGRWGSSDSRLGIPIVWKDISLVGGIVEASIENYKVDPSQGTHFFHNITSLGVIYFTVYQQEDFLRWDKLNGNFNKNILEVVEETKFISHIKLSSPVIVKIDTKTGLGVLGF